MPSSFTFISGDQAAPPDPRAIPCLVLPTTSGTPGTPVRLDPGDDVVAALGPGKAAAWVMSIHAASGSRIEVSPATATWTSLSGNLTQTGSGPAIAISNAAGYSGAVDDFPGFKLTVVAGGVLGVAAADISYDGTSVADSVILPPEGPAVVRGTVDISGSVPAMDTLTLVFSAPSSTTLTFTSSPTTPDALVTAFDALAVAGSLAVRSRIYESATGAKYFEVFSTAVGTTAGVTISSTSTGEATLGLATTAAAGTAASLTLPNTGAKLTFSAGTYVAGEKYTRALVGPTASLSAQSDAATVAHTERSTHPFGYLVFGEQASHVAAATLAGTIGTSVASWAADADAPAFVDFVIGTAFHTASATKATNRANIATSDAAFVAAIAGLSADKSRNFAHGDCYVDAPGGLPIGRFRRSAALAGAMRRASLDRIGGNPAAGTIPLISLLAADGLTLARNEADAGTKLGDLTGKAWTLKATSAGLGSVKFAPAPSGAGSLSRFRDPGVVAVAYSLASAIFTFTESWEGESMETDPESPKAATAEELTARQHALEDYLRPIVRPENKPANISGELAIACAAPTVLDDGDVAVATKYNPLSLIRGVSVTITATGKSLTIEG